MLSSPKRSICSWGIALHYVCCFLNPIYGLPGTVIYLAYDAGRIGIPHQPKARSAPEYFVSLCAMPLYLSLCGQAFYSSLLVYLEKRSSKTFCKSCAQQVRIPRPSERDV